LYIKYNDVDFFSSLEKIWGVYMPESYTYPAKFYIDSDGITIKFPDLPGCLSCADTIKEALYNAKEALELYMFGLEEDGEIIPKPTDMNKIPLKSNEVLASIKANMVTARKEVISFKKEYAMA